MHLTIDIGGTTTRIGVSKDGKALIHVQKYPTVQDYREALTKLAETANHLLSGELPAKISVGLPGVLDKYHGTIIRTPHLPEWRGKSIRQDLEKLLKTKILIENDAALAGLAEAHFGAGKGVSVLAYLTISTGIGGSRIIKGQIDHSNFGFEPGHQILDPQGKYWPACGQTGCFESIASGSAFAQEYGIQGQDCHNPTIWATHAKKTAPGIINLITFWSPDRLVLGGGMSRAGEQFLSPLRHYIEEGLKILPTPEIRVSNLGDDNVLLGGLVAAQ